MEVNKLYVYNSAFTTKRPFAWLVPLRFQEKTRNTVPSRGFSLHERWRAWTDAAVKTGIYDTNGNVGKKNPRRMRLDDQIKHLFTPRKSKIPEAFARFNLHSSWKGKLVWRIVCETLIKPYLPQTARYVLDKLIEGIYATRWPFEPVFVQH